MMLHDLSVTVRTFEEAVCSLLFSLSVVCCSTGHAGTRCFSAQLLYPSLRRAKGSESSRASNELCKNSGEMPEDCSAIGKLTVQPHA